MKVKYIDKTDAVTDELYTEFYVCPHCDHRQITSWFLFCPICGHKVHHKPKLKRRKRK